MKQSRPYAHSPPAGWVLRPLEPPGSRQGVSGANGIIHAIRIIDFIGERPWT
jgi:hypothetical protein